MKASFVKSAVHVDQLPRSAKPQIALLGRSNVGKSSFINHLAGTKGLARTSQDPGLTRTVNIYDFEGGFFLVDLPGYGYTRAKPSKIGDLTAIISEYLSGSEHLKLVLMLIDCRHGFTEIDSKALAELQESGIPYAVILNKTDQLSKSAGLQALRKMQNAHPEIVFGSHSVKDSDGLGLIRNMIASAART